MLKKHLERHGEPELSCDNCHEKFFTEYEVNRHAEVHVDAKINSLFCSTKFNSQFKMSMHIHEYHEAELKDKLENTIQEFLDEGRKITYSDISDEIGINRSLINHNQKYLDLFKKLVDLKFEYLEVTKMAEEERISCQKEIISTAIERIKNRGDEITQVSVADEIGVNRIIFNYNPEFKELIEQNRSGKGGYNLEYLISQVEECVQKLEIEGEKVTYSNIAERLDIYVGTISEKDEIRQIVEKQRKGYLPGQRVQRSEVVEIIEDLKKTNTSLSKRKILQRLHCDWPKIEQQKKLAKLIENEVITHNETLERDFQKKIKMSVDDLIESNQDISFREVARRVDLDAHGLLDNEERKLIVEKGIQRQERRRKNLIKQTCTNLIHENKQISFIEVHRRTGLPRSKIEGKYRWLVENMQSSQAVK